MSLYDKYGSITLPEGFILYHGRENLFDKNLYDCVFCTFDGGWSGKYTYKIKLKKPLKCLFMVEAIRPYSHYDCVCALPEICKDIFNIDVKCNEVDIKQKKSTRNKIIKYFQNKEIYAWFTSIEGKSDNEICIFVKNFDEYIDIEQISEDQIDNCVSKMRTDIKLPDTFDIQTDLIQHNYKSSLYTYDLLILFKNGGIIGEHDYK